MNEINVRALGVPFTIKGKHMVAATLIGLVVGITSTYFYINKKPLTAIG